MSMSVAEAIKRIQNHMEVHRIGQHPHIYIGEALTMAIDALKEKAERENPAPLTMEELVMMDCEPVWIRDKHNSGYEFSEDAADYFEGRNPKEYGKTWIAYRHKPKEETHG